MTDDAATSEQEFADRLAAYDEAIAGGSSILPFDTPSDQQPRIEKRIELLHRLQQLRPAIGPAADPGGCTRVGRFEVVRELGRGGFGVVFLAVDPILDRSVAVKVPHAGLLETPDLLERFRREAQAAAGLNHPNVVPVFETGQVGPVLYLVSTYCPGGSLAGWLSERLRPVSGVAAAGLLAALADGVQHAHDHGILHRDLKPGNVLLEWPAGTPDRTNLSTATPRVGDFGLAKFLGRGVATVTGAALGTPSYMAPEQCRGSGDKVGPTTDVYALGAILYEVLTTRPPFTGDTPLDILDQVRTAYPVPPSRLRPGLARDLETVCMKCLEKEPGRRYATAAALAADLRRFLAGQPVVARPLGLAGRAVRWARQKPAVAGLAATLAVAVVAGSAGVVWQWRRAEHLAAAHGRERDLARAAQETAERDYRHAHSAVDRLTNLGEELTRQPASEATGRAVLEQALVFYERFLADHGDAPDVYRQVARAHFRVGQICYRLGRYPQAKEAFRRAAGLFERLTADHPDEIGFRYELGVCLRDFANLYRESGRKAEADETYVAAERHTGAAVAARPNDVGYRLAHANTLVNRAVLLRDTNRRAEAEAAIKEAARLQESAGTAGLGELAMSLDELCPILLARSDQAGAEKLCRRVLDMRTELARTQDVAARHYLARSHARLAGILALGRRWDEADQEYRTAADILTQVTVDRPTSAHGYAELKTVQSSRAAALWFAGRLDAAEAVARDELAHAEQLIATYPSEIRVRQQIVRGFLILAKILEDEDRYTEAIAVYRKVKEIDPDNPAVLSRGAWAIAQNRTATDTDRQESVRLAERAVAIAPTNTEYRFTLGVCRLRAGDLAAAVADLRAAARARKVPDAYDLFCLTMTQFRAGSVLAARRCHDEVAALIKNFSLPASERSRLLAEGQSSTQISPPPPGAR
ncbi:serine/threonine-protein kinase [Fimbriiglobus ruber]|uniref:Serine/threonine protein kinase PrkC, regulator of stationary phase n=1 Tax=Fimbriiglobus ruber TaxID=1908690 RepID=A0A225DDZ9_9BACT|nr:serine/threonine-protein kinase [Fimbriiglobus ruber]OWK39692.1 Serine/threonine protein kinase PrkC, regulator of stationary phase [Fimbriiglobus ruber]